MTRLRPTSSSINALGRVEEALIEKARRLGMSAVSLLSGRKPRSIIVIILRRQSRQ